MSDIRGGEGGRTRESWHLDKRVPIVLIVAIVVQTGGAVWWARGKDIAIDDAAKQITALQSRTSDTDKAVARLELRSASIEQSLATVIEQNRQLGGDVREMTRSIIRLETIMRADSRDSRRDFDGGGNNSGNNSGNGNRPRGGGNNPAGQP